MKHIFINKNSNKTFVILHGTGGDESDLVGVAEYIDSTANILGIRGNVVENGMNRFFKRFGMGSYDLNSYELETNNLNEAILKYSKQYNIDLLSITILGFSNGANIALGLIQDFPLNYNKYILLSNDYINKDKEFKDLNKMKIFMTSSLNDSFVNFESIELLIKRLRENNAIVNLEMVSGHKISKEALDKLKEIYKEW